MKILIILDPRSLSCISKKTKPIYSHDLNTLGLARTAFFRGYEVYILVKKEPYCFCKADRFFKINKISNDYILDIEPVTSKIKSINLIASCFLHHLLDIKKVNRNCKVLCMTPALYFIEDSKMVSKKDWFSHIHALCNDVDFISFQNERMREVGYTFYHLLSGWSRKDRMPIAPLGPSQLQFPDKQTRLTARASLGFEEDDIVIVNAGGVWKWTDFYTFLDAFFSSVKAGNTNLKLIISGMRQKENADHKEYIKSVWQLIEKNRKIFDHNIYFEKDWNKASGMIATYLAASDIGLNINQDGLENFQSHRVRCIDYISAGLPFINTMGDTHSKNSANVGAVIVRPEDKQNYISVLDEIAKGNLLEDAKKAVRSFATSILQEKVYNNLLDAIDKTPNETRDAYVSDIPLISMIDPFAEGGKYSRSFKSKFMKIILRILLFIHHRIIRIMQIFPGGDSFYYKTFNRIRKIDFFDRLIKKYLY